MLPILLELEVCFFLFLYLIIKGVVIREDTKEILVIQERISLIGGSFRVIKVFKKIQIIGKYQEVW